MKHPRTRVVGLVLAFALITCVAFYAAYEVSTSETLQTMVRSWGIIGMLLLSFAVSLNTLVPIPQATFAPIFLSAGITPLVVVLIFTIGATLADSVSYFFGRLGRTHAARHHTGFIARIDAFLATHRNWVLPSAYLYMAFAPFPNEYIMIPLGLAGFRYRQLLVPLAVGNLIYFSWTIYGFGAIFSWLF